LNVYKGISQAEAGLGEIILFWKDMWNGSTLQIKYPQLFSFCTHENSTLSAVMNQEDLHDNFQLPLSEQAFQQYCELEMFMQSLQLNENGDQWTYIWGSAHYSSSKAYKHLSGSNSVHPVYKWLWTSSCQQKQKRLY
jgi:hypothetical protein